jgi:hypothetical protein
MKAEGVPIRILRLLDCILHEAFSARTKVNISYIRTSCTTDYLVREGSSPYFRHEKEITPFYFGPGGTKMTLYG